MARYYNRSRMNFRNVIMIVLVAAISIAAFAVLGVSLGKKNGTTLDFTVGSLDVNGKYKASESMLYTKESVEFDTVTVTRDFESTTKYKLYFYDKNDTFVECTDILDESADFTAPAGATHFRVVLIPTFEPKAEKVIKAWNVSKYENEFHFDVELIVENTDDLTNPA